MLAIAVVLVVGCSGTASRAGSPSPPHIPRQGALGTTTTSARRISDQATAIADADAFLRRYVDDTGRVVRADQGGDTVSEGQSYGLLLAEAAGRTAEAARIWEWTREHLQRPDGLLAFHASPSGRIIDRASATDADLVTAWALVRIPRLRPTGAAIAKAILARETVLLPDGHILLAAGDWATGRPASLNPSYWVLPAVAGLAAAVPDHRWASVRGGAEEALGTLTGGGVLLPPDWARDDGGRLSATPAPNRAVPDVRYSFDAQRCLVWMAAAPGGPGAGRYAALLQRESTAAASSLRQDGTTIDTRPSPLAVVAAAAAEHAAGDDASEHRLLDEADAIEQGNPTYYGAAWVALGRVLLTTDLLA